MSSIRGFLVLLPAFWIFTTSELHAQLDKPGERLSRRQEIQNSIDRGRRFLLSQQNSNGWWSTPDHTAVSALVLSALEGDPGAFKNRDTSQIRRGFDFVLSHQKTNGGIYVRDLPNYNTAVSLMALVNSRDERHREPILKARGFLIDLQQKPGSTNGSVFEGGVGYGSRYSHSDLNNTLMSLEALHYSRSFATASEGKDRFNWQAAIQFLKNCQNWEGSGSNDFGGFIYYPGHSMAGSVTNQGKVSLRSYGSASYAGLLSFIYADLSRDDARLKGVLDWLDRNYTLAENPGMGQQGYFYYMHLATKALALTEIHGIPTGGNKSSNWKTDLTTRLINLQQKDGSWFNENNRWWEKDPILTTSYALLSLELLYQRL